MENAEILKHINRCFAKLRRRTHVKSSSVAIRTASGEFTSASMNHIANKLTGLANVAIGSVADALAGAEALADAADYSYPYCFRYTPN